jgi:diguanylate cyclase (GGDEF)-like protein
LTIFNSKALNYFVQRSLVFQLWLVLSLIAGAITAVALGVYVWLSVEDGLTSASRQVEGKIQVVLATAPRFQTDGLQPQDRLAVANSLGIKALEVFDASGLHNQTVVAGSGTGSTDPGFEALIRDTISGQPSQRTVRFEDGSFRAGSISPLDVIRGGSFGEEHLIPLSAAIANQQGAMRIVVSYPDVTHEARTLVYRSILAALVIVSATTAGMWLFLGRFISGPLRRYSQLAMQISRGDPVRMPARGDDELSKLGRALNGMADALEHEATVDALTGLYNLRHLSSNLEALIASARLKGETLAVIVGDLDNLKPVNDTFGHQVGDQLLRAVAATIQAWACADCTCWRLGGDEFVVALPNTDPAGALLSAETLRKAVSSILLPVADTQIRTSISLGVAYYPADGATAGTLLGIADRRMYSSKSLRGEETQLLEIPAA